LSSLKNHKNHKNYNCCATTDSGKEYLIYAGWLYNNNQANFRGWHCDAGTTRLYIDSDLELYSGECKNNHLGSVVGDFKLLDNNICIRDTCTSCTDDLVVAKEKR
jgi:hypothetical protein